MDGSFALRASGFTWG